MINGPSRVDQENINKRLTEKFSIDQTCNKGQSKMSKLENNAENAIAVDAHYATYTHDTYEMKSANVSKISNKSYLLSSETHSTPIS